MIAYRLTEADERMLRWVRSKGDIDSIRANWLGQYHAYAQDVEIDQETQKWRYKETPPVVSLEHQQKAARFNALLIALKNAAPETNQERRSKFGSGRSPTPYRED